MSYEFLIGSCIGVMLGLHLWAGRLIKRLYDQTRDLECAAAAHEARIGAIEDKIGGTISSPSGQCEEEHPPGQCEACDYDRAAGELPVARVVRRPGGKP